MKCPNCGCNLQAEVKLRVEAKAHFASDTVVGSKRRWHMEKKGVMVEAQYDENGYDVLKEMRERMPEFKGARIINVIQEWAAAVECGVIYRTGTWPLVVYKQGEDRG